LPNSTNAKIYAIIASDIGKNLHQNNVDVDVKVKKLSTIDHATENHRVCVLVFDTLWRPKKFAQQTRKELLAGSALLCFKTHPTQRQMIYQRRYYQKRENIAKHKRYDAQRGATKIYINLNKK
jgi:hypothetical protein